VCPQQVDGLLDAVEDVENDARTLLGLELASVVANEAQLDAAMKRYVRQIGELGKVSAAYRGSYEGLTTAVASLGQLGVWLEQSESALRSAGDNLAAIARGLESS